MPALTAKLFAQVVGLASGERTIDATWAVSDPVEEVKEIRLAIGNNTIAWPSGATIAIIQPPLAESATVQLRGAGGDTGMNLSVTLPTIITNGGVPNFVLNSDAVAPGAWTISYL